METAGYVAIAMFMAGVIFNAGYLTARVSHLEQWRGELLLELSELRASVGHIEQMLEHRAR